MHTEMFDRSEIATMVEINHLNPRVKGRGGLDRRLVRLAHLYAGSKPGTAKAREIETSLYLEGEFGRHGWEPHLSLEQAIEVARAGRAYIHPDRKMQHCAA